MPLKELFKTKPKYITIKPDVKTAEPIPEEQPEKRRKELGDLHWTKCTDCGQIIYKKDLAKNMLVCPRCEHHFRVSARDRIAQILDPDSFKEMFTDLRSIDPLQFPDYPAKLKRAQRETNLDEGVLVGRGAIDHFQVGFAAMDSNFMIGSMGSVVGEKITMLIEYCLDNRLPLIIVAAGGGGARMQEGIFSLMQMAKTSAALARFGAAGLLYISVLTDPTMGGVFASFATLGDVIICEPGALLGFTGPRVIQQTIRQTLPEGFQSSKFQLDHGLADMIVGRKDLRRTLAQLLRFHGAPEEAE